MTAEPDVGSPPSWQNRDWMNGADALRDAASRTRAQPLTLTENPFMTGAAPTTANGAVADVAAVAHVAPPAKRETEGDALLTDVCAFVARFVRFHSPEQLHTVALWIVHEHAIYECFDTTPYLVVESPVRRCGKTRLLDVLDALCARGWSFTGMPSEAVLYRGISDSRYTPIIDEVDMLLGAAHTRVNPLIGIINGGNRRGAMVPRCIGEGSKQEIKSFNVFGAKAFGGIALRQIAPDTLLDRSIVITLQRKFAGERMERWQQRRIGAEVTELRERIASWVASHLDELRGVEPPDIAEIDDRAAEGWFALCAVAEIAGGDWPRRARIAALAVSGGEEREGEGHDVLLLRDLRAIFASHGVNGKLSTGTAVAQLNAMEERPWSALRDGQGIDATRVARLLKPFGIRSKVVRIGEATPRGWEVDEFVDAWQRYASSSQSPQHHQRPQHPQQEGGAT